ncbi:predicted protein [Uncinocarpus reesii 1704]|uniref:Uncharacterized protein n=1 Tax=Uncinocarpus reesii (strain UAMH 1704) TaxID=336963 RepID=C4JY64_UNCRE|nr:uncharacterized protein UREG_07115 [Uncinocarpus reesii 1704]EEP82250.1 predicted protein [Uncinocarpus reesii 1704]
MIDARGHGKANWEVDERRGVIFGWAAWTSISLLRSIVKHRPGNTDEKGAKGTTGMADATSDDELDDAGTGGGRRRRRERERRGRGWPGEEEEEEEEEEE